MFKSVAIFAAAFTALASPTAAKPLTVRIGETWLFSVRHGAPVDAHKVVPANAGASGQFKVSLQPLFGATMTITNASRFDYAYRATLVLPSGESGTAKACAVPANNVAAVEHWAKPLAAVRLDRFKPALAGSLCP